MFDYIKNQSLRRYASYTFGGVVMLLIKVFITVVLTELFQVNYILSYAIALTGIVLFGFYFNFHVTFKNRTRKARKFTKYSAASILFDAGDFIAVIIMTELLFIPYWLSIWIASATVFLTRYFVIKKFIFS